MTHPATTATSDQEPHIMNTLSTTSNTADQRDAQAWFDEHPHPENVLLSSAMRDNREGVWMLILDRFDEMHEIACAKRAELRRNATVATTDGLVIKPDSLLLRSLCNADEARSLDRSRYLITVGA
ncbi:hypothetical protein E3O45_15145 [Cryobacterium sp. TMS1-20-1]|uniref:hypothetical protein n=1 Tax=Cryobacterium sp. TMS1-20-1 TaxID=1259223 RepID=UPI00106BEF62|nr:hypothetical protein [Cryobacterium sp. TMS1-20-1]TFC71407.1 hypothetical protein E3O45_15145 [Cryobacterium sp. TMS1-20-1]